MKRIRETLGTMQLPHIVKDLVNSSASKVIENSASKATASGPSSPCSEQRSSEQRPNRGSWCNNRVIRTTGEAGVISRTADLNLAGERKMSEQLTDQELLLKSILPNDDIITAGLDNTTMPGIMPGIMPTIRDNNIMQRMSGLENPLKSAKEADDFCNEVLNSMGPLVGDFGLGDLDGLGDLKGHNGLSDLAANSCEMILSQAAGRQGSADSIITNGIHDMGNGLNDMGNGLNDMGLGSTMSQMNAGMMDAQGMDLDSLLGIGTTADMGLLGHEALGGVNSAKKVSPMRSYDAVGNGDVVGDLYSKNEPSGSSCGSLFEKLYQSPDANGSNSGSREPNSSPQRKRMKLDELIQTTGVLPPPPRRPKKEEEDCCEDGDNSEDGGAPRRGLINRVEKSPSSATSSKDACNHNNTSNIISITKDKECENSNENSDNADNNSSSTACTREDTILGSVSKKNQPIKEYQSSKDQSNNNNNSNYKSVNKTIGPPPFRRNFDRERDISYGNKEQLEASPPWSNFHKGKGKSGKDYMWNSRSGSSSADQKFGDRPTYRKGDRPTYRKGDWTQPAVKGGFRKGKDGYGFRSGEDDAWMDEYVFEYLSFLEAGGGPGNNPKMHMNHKNIMANSMSSAGPLPNGLSMSGNNPLMGGNMNSNLNNMNPLGLSSLATTTGMGGTGIIGGTGGVGHNINNTGHNNITSIMNGGNNNPTTMGGGMMNGVLNGNTSNNGMMNSSNNGMMNSMMNGIGNNLNFSDKEWSQWLGDWGNSSSNSTSSSSNSGITNGITTNGITNSSIKGGGGGPGINSSMKKGSPTRSNGSGGNGNGPMNPSNTNTSNMNPSNNSGDSSWWDNELWKSLTEDSNSVGNSGGNSGNSNILDSLFQGGNGPNGMPVSGNNITTSSTGIMSLPAVQPPNMNSTMNNNSGGVCVVNNSSQKSKSPNILNLLEGDPSALDGDWTQFFTG